MARKGVFFNPAGEIQQGKGELLRRVHLDINPAVDTVLRMEAEATVGFAAVLTGTW